MVDIRPTSELKERRVVRGEGCHDQPVQVLQNHESSGDLTMRVVFMQGASFIWPPLNVKYNAL